jgi:hypothetical protein
LGNRFPIFPLSSRLYRAAVSTPPELGLSATPFLRPLSLAEGRIEGTVFPDFVSGGWPFPRQEVALLPWMVFPFLAGPPIVLCFFLVYQAEAGSLRGVALVGCSHHGGCAFSDRIFFPVYWAGLFPFPRRGSPKRVPSCLRMFLFQGFPQPPFSHLHGRPGLSSAVAFLTPGKEPLPPFPPSPFRGGFAVALPFCGLPQGGAFLDDLSSR